MSGIWKELREALGADADLLCEFWGVSASGNFEGANILHRPIPLAEFAESRGLDTKTLQEKLAVARAKLYARRAERIPPLLDDKIITSWNGLMLAALAEAARILDDGRYRQAATRAGNFLLRELRSSEQPLLRTYRQGESKIPAFLEDYACLIEGLLELYQLTFEERWFREARALAEHALSSFAGPEGGYYDSAEAHEPLIARARNLQDGSFPAANAHFAAQLLRLGAYTGEAHYEAAALSALQLTRAGMQQIPQAFAGSLNALDMLVSGITEIAIIGDSADEATGNLLSVIREAPPRHRVIALATEAEAANSEIALLRGRPMLNGRPTAFVCRNFVCDTPVTSAEALREQLREPLRAG